MASVIDRQIAPTGRRVTSGLQDPPQTALSCKPAIHGDPGMHYFIAWRQSAFVARNLWLVQRAMCLADDELMPGQAVRQRNSGRVPRTAPRACRIERQETRWKIGFSERVNLGPKNRRPITAYGA